MSTYTQILYQIVFSTKYREDTLLANRKIELYKFIWGVIKKKNCLLYQINGVEDHIHILLSLHPSIALASLVKDIKLSSSAFIHETNIFPEFNGWQDGYGAFTYAYNAKDKLIDYIKNQEEHHRHRSYREEFIELLKEHHVEFKEEYLD